ncbi:hypothetical protein EVG20_g5541 [Dentipellis fragilis]|uniref:F-box domain-containing protein n=1 Tax=Dentipellis fragilis TaxID=205917 RepID=A0A4Y9YT01_9AGAM|nr:hypothetical protein EVG20_g5541 [Dentipellis fragilis]
MSHLRPRTGSDAAEQEVQRLNNEYQNLIVQLNSITSRMVANRAGVNSLTPISSLPTELLIHIFSFLSQAGDLISRISKNMFLPKRVRLGEIGSTSPIPAHTFGVLGPEWTNLVLSRSRSLPVSIAFEHTGLGFSRPSSVSTCSEPRVSLIADHRARVKLLRVNAQIIAPKFTFTWMLAQLHGNFPLLEKLELHGERGSSENEIARIPMQHFQSMPALKELVLDNIVPSWTSGSASFAFSNLTTFDLGVGDADEGDMFSDPGALPGEQDVHRSQLFPTLPQLLNVLENLSIHEALPDMEFVSTLGWTDSVVILPRSRTSVFQAVESKPIWSLNEQCNLTGESLEFQFLRNAFAAMPVSDTTSFDVVVDWGSETQNADLIEDLFGQPSLAAVSSVVVCGNTLYPLCPALLRPVSDIQLDEYPLPDHLRALNVLPGLQDVFIMNVSCIPLGLNERALLRDEILNVIREREHRGIPLRRVVFLDYGSAKNLEWLQSMEAVFPEIIYWDS